MYERDIPPHLNRLIAWYDKIGALDCVEQANGMSRFEALLEEHKLKESN